MFWTLERLAGPEDEPITLAEMRLHLREYAGVTDNDSEYTALIKEGREWVEQRTGRALHDQQWVLTMTPEEREVTATTVSSGTTEWTPQQEIILRRSPALEINSVETISSAGAETTIDAAAYELREAGSRWPRLVVLDSSTWSVSSSDDVRITFRAGFLDQEMSPVVGEVPEVFVRAIKLYASAMYEMDEKLMEKQLDVARRLIKPQSAILSMA
jgi:uncharacterized phiE125 gp8 family phage protein